MKASSVIICVLFTVTTAFGQIANSNTLAVDIDGVAYKTPPRRIRIGTAWWVTANSVKPDKSLRFWLVSYNKDGKNNDGIDPGTYLVVDADKPTTKENRKKYEDTAKYRGFVVIKYVEETRTPRMEYHVGKSQNNDETMEVNKAADGSFVATFSGTLAGSHWKERTTATVFGGVGRLVNKMEDKVITSATGYESDIDPEGNGYKRQEKTDQIVLKNGSFMLKLN
jgi:hypothetical protein